MNYSTAVFLINDKARAVYGTYEAGKDASKTLFKTLDQTLKVDDFALVPTNTRHNMTVVKITDVDVDFDIETSVHVEWIIGRIELADYASLVAQEQEAITTIQSAQKAKKREELRKALLADADNKLSALPIAAIGQDKLIGGEATS